MADDATQSAVPGPGHGSPMRRVVVTGGAGFIGSNLVAELIADDQCTVLNIDKLAMPGSIHTLESFAAVDRHHFVKLDLCDRDALRRALFEFQPDAVFHLAAESHVDRSIDEPAGFIHSNVLGSFHLFEVGLEYWRSQSPARRARFRLVHVSTDEVMGSLAESEAPFTEASPYRPNSPYSASKAAADHLARAWHRTYGLPVIVTNCSNNYGPRQYPEKLIPLALLRALRGEDIPVYGDGRNIRDWLYVGDHVAALKRVMAGGTPGETYNIGGSSEVRNIDLVQRLCDVLDRLRPRARGSYREQIAFVADRPGHDYRYAIDSSKIAHTLGWRPAGNFEERLAETVRWYLDNLEWCERVTAGHYGGERLGLSA